MAEISSFTSKFRAQKIVIHPHETPTKVTKRPRLVCNQCQRSKLRCDRGQPCSTCEKRNEGASCSYNQPKDSRTSARVKPAGEDRLLHLESMVKELMQTRTPPQNGNVGLPVEYDAPQEISNGHQRPVHNNPAGPVDAPYVGSTHWSAILDDIQELKASLGGRVETHEREQPVDSLSLTLTGDPIFGKPNDYSLSQIMSQYLPPKLETDRLLSLYFQGETYIVPFVHTYHFQKQYKEFWEDISKVNPLWLSMLFSICHMASLVMESPPSSSPQNGPPSRLSTFHAAAAQCLVLGCYQRRQKFAVEALAMYGHCKHLGCLDPSREGGTIMSMVVRLAHEMGYHRDPDSFGSFTPFEAEMQRRCWAACKQMDLMISFQLGLPCNVCLENCDTKSPRNLLDSEFDEDAQVLPPSRPETENTKLLWFVVKERQMVCFSKVCRDALSFREKSEAEVLELDAEIREMHNTIPAVLKTRPISDSIADSPFVVMTRIYIEFIHLKSLCVLHRKYMARGNVISTRHCIEAGIKLVSQFIDMYKEFSPGGKLCQVCWMLTNFSMNDFLLGVMVLCLVIHRSKAGAQNSAIEKTTENEVLDLLQKSHAICVEKSEASRDAKRVSYAIQLILNGARHQQQLLTPPLTSGLSSVPNGTSFNGDIASLDLPVNESTDILLPAWYNYIHDDQATLGQLDPFNFNFSGGGFEDMGWASLDSGI